MSDPCEHTEHLHCNVCGGAVCRSCYGTMAPTAPIKYGPSFPQNHTVARLNAQIAALTAKLERVRKLVKQIEKNSPDAWARMKAEQIFREVGHE